MAILLHSLTRETTLTPLSGRSPVFYAVAGTGFDVFGLVIACGELCNPPRATLGHVGANASDRLCPDRRRSAHCSARILQFRMAERVGLFPNYRKIRAFAQGPGRSAVLRYFKRYIERYILTMGSLRRPSTCPSACRPAGRRIGRISSQRRLQRLQPYEACHLPAVTKLRLSGGGTRGRAR